MSRDRARHLRFLDIDDRLFFAEPVSTAEARFHARYARSYQCALMEAVIAARGTAWLLAPYHPTGGPSPLWHLTSAHLSDVLADAAARYRVATSEPARGTS